MRRYGARLGASRFVAGTRLEEAVAAVERLNADGREATLDHLGEFIRDKRDAILAADMCLNALDAIQSYGLHANLSLKLTSLGLDIDKELSERLLRSILDRASQQGCFVRIDMEDYARCQPALDLYKKLKSEYSNVGIVIQAYLRRSKDDVRELGKGVNLRLVKGAYKESSEVAFARKKEVDDAFAELIALQLSQGYAAIATHDENMIDQSLKCIQEQHVPRDRFEFQMLYGIREDLQCKLASEGYVVRVYVPYGEDWFGYFMRRLAERPANLWFLLKHWRS